MYVFFSFSDTIYNKTNDQRLHGTVLKDLMDSFNMTQLCNQATHLNTEGMAESLLDSIFSNVRDLFSPSVDVMPPISSSDHLPVIVHSTGNYYSTIQNPSGYVPTLTSQTQWYFYLKDKEKCLMHSSLTTGHM